MKDCPKYFINGVIFITKRVIYWNLYRCRISIDNLKMCSNILY